MSSGRYRDGLVDIYKGRLFRPWPLREQENSATLMMVAFNTNSYLLFSSEFQIITVNWPGHQIFLQVCPDAQRSVHAGYDPVENIQELGAVVNAIYPCLAFVSKLPSLLVVSQHLAARSFKGRQTVHPRSMREDRAHTAQHCSHADRSLPISCSSSRISGMKADTSCRRTSGSKAGLGARLSADNRWNADSRASAGMMVRIKRLARPVEFRNRSQNTLRGTP